jgi:hypothetical protein
MQINKSVVAVAFALTVALIGCSNDEVFPTAANFPVAAPANLDATAGSWRMIFLGAPNTFVVPAPTAVSSAAYQAELATVKSVQAALTGAQKDNVKFWGAGGTLRWNEIMRATAARFALPPAPLPNDTYPAPNAANPAVDPVFPFANPPYSTRAYSYLTVAQFDALKVAWFYKFQFNRPAAAKNDPGVQQLVPITDLPQYPSEDGVIAGVSSAILAALFPVAAEEIGQASVDHQAFAVHSGKCTQSDVDAGFALGRTIAAQFLARANNDGFRNAQGTPAQFQVLIDAAVARGDTPWRSLETPPRPPQLPFFGRVQPWMLTQAEIIANRPPAPPPTNSAAFKAETELVKQTADSLNRDQLATVYKWGDGVGTYAPSGHWNLIAAKSLASAGFSEVRVARTFAFLNTAQYDAVVGCWDAKYFYMIPRPTQMDPSIKCHTGLPNFPAYTSGHSSFSAAAAAVLGSIFPGSASFFDKERDEAGNSRFFGGIHYATDCETGKLHGKQLAQFTLNFASTDGAGN